MVRQGGGVCATGMFGEAAHAAALLDLLSGRAREEVYGPHASGRVEGPIRDQTITHQCVRFNVEKNK